MESTRRDFLKRMAGTAATAAFNPGVTEIANAASSSHYSPATFNFGYELSDAITVPSLTQLFETLWSSRGRKYTSSELKQHVEKSAKLLASGRPLDAKTILMLVASDANAMSMSASLKAHEARKYAKSIDSSDQVDYETFYDVFFEEQLEMLGDFFANGDMSFFNNMWPLDIMMNNKVILSKKKAIEHGIFSTVAQIKAKASETTQQVIEHINKRQAAKQQQSLSQSKHQDNIEYAPADYKGSWQHDADYQSLSMGESFNAGAANKRKRTK